MNPDGGTRALVLGGAGFLGSAIVRALLDGGAEVSVVARPSTSLAPIQGVLSKVHLCQIDASDRSAVQGVVQDLRPALIFNCVSGNHRPSSPLESEVSWRSTVDATACVLEAVSTVARACRIVHLGSSLEYRRSRAPLSEDDPLDPHTVRGQQKAQASRLCFEAASRGTNVVVVRPFSVYGPWEPSDRLIPTAIRAAMNGRSMDLTRPGIRHDFVHVDDVADVCLLAAAKLPAGTAVNAGTGVAHSNEEVVTLLGEVCGVDIPVRMGAFPGRPADTDHWVADTRRAQELFGWNPRSLRSGLRATLLWMQEPLRDDVGAARL